MLQEEEDNCFAKDYVGVIGLNEVHGTMVCITHLHMCTLSGQIQTFTVLEQIAVGINDICYCPK